MESIEKNLIIGITGIIGSGKTTVAKYFESLDFPVLYADEIAKKIISENKQVKTKIISLLGPQAYNTDEMGTPNRKFIAEAVFQDKKKLELLNRIIHPVVIDTISDLCEMLFADGADIIFVESALMFETGTFEGYDYVIAISCPEETAISRVIARSGLTKKQVEQRLANQFNNSKKVSLADFSILNNGSEEELLKAADFILSIIKDMPPNKFDDED